MARGPEGAGSDVRRRSTMSALNCDNSVFGEVNERRVTFCVDTSGSMYDCLDTIKDQLIQVLEDRARRARDGDSFNVIEFSTMVVQWADEMVSWTPATVAVASKWIRDLRPKTGTNTHDAVVAALSDQTCDAVYLVTDSVPDQPVDDVVDAVLRVAGSRPIHCRYIQRHTADSAALAFLRDLAVETFGSLLVTTVSARGDVLGVVPIYRAEMTAERVVRTTNGAVFPSGYKMCSVGTSLDRLPPTTPASVTAVVAPTIPPWPYCMYPWPYRYYHTVVDDGGPAVMRWRPGKAWMKHTREFSDRIVAAPVPGAGAMLVGQQVLARRHRDGFFYVGTVKSQVCNHHHHHNRHSLLIIRPPGSINKQNKQIASA